MSWVVWPDRETGAKAHDSMYADPRMTALGEMPFDSNRMILGGLRADPRLSQKLSVQPSSN